MKFDKMCRAAEALGGQFERLMRYSSLLVVDDKDIAPGGWFSQELIDGFANDFRLPWPATVVDWGKGAALVARVGKSKANIDFKNFEVEVERDYIDRSQRVGTESIGVLPNDVFAIASTLAAEDGQVLTIFALQMTVGKESGDDYSVGVQPDTTFVVSEKSIKRLDHMVEVEGRKFAGVVTQSLRSAWVYAYGHLVEAMKPGNWIVSKSASDARNVDRSPKIPRSHQRRHYIIISDAERRRVFRESVEREGHDGQVVTPHARRAHYRHIGDNEDGSRRYTWVRSCWVGSTEAEIRGQRYRVELDL